MKSYPVKDYFNQLLGGGFKHFLFSPLFGEDEPILSNIFRMGWFNHQLELDGYYTNSIPSLPKSPKYLVSRCLDPLKAFSGGVCGSKHLLTRYLED